MRLSRRTWWLLAILVTIAGVVLVGVVVTEWNYVDGHPDAYGPAKVIAGAAGAAALLAGAVTLIALDLATAAENREQATVPTQRPRALGSTARKVVWLGGIAFAVAFALWAVGERRY